MGRSRESLVFARFGTTRDEAKFARLARYTPKRLLPRRSAILHSCPFAVVLWSRRGSFCFSCGLRNGFRPFGEEIAEVVARRVLDIIMDNLIHVFPVHIDRRDLELAA